MSKKLWLMEKKCPFGGDLNRVDWTRSDQELIIVDVLSASEFQVVHVIFVMQYQYKYINPITDTIRLPAADLHNVIVDEVI